MSYDCIRIERERDGYSVTVTDPAIVAANQKRNSGDGPSVGEWKDPNIEFEFTTKAEVVAFIEKAMDTALPAEEYSTAFDKFAKEAKEAK